jgi:SAM-dependent methyltransferase
MTAEASVNNSLGLYACPACKGLLSQEPGLLRCPGCSKTYPVEEGIPDFLGEVLSQSKDPELRRMRAIDKMARIYETKLWYPVVMNVYGGFATSTLAQLIAKVTAKIEAVEGRVVDIACGPGTYGRRAASPSKQVFGIDVSMGMLRQGVAYTIKEDNPFMRFARARVEALPFENNFFDAALCCGSLHLFTDTVAALREIARVMKPGAILSVFTFGAGRGGILKFRSVRDWFRKRAGLHAFELRELDGSLAESGFTGFQPEMAGSVLTFSARKQAVAN